MPEISFTVGGKPKGKARPRFTRTGHTYTPKTTRDYETAIRVKCIEAMHGMKPFSGRVEVLISASFEVPKSWPKAKREAYHKYTPGRPDVDNVVKAVLDACNGIAFYDDAQVAVLYATKSYVPSQPGINVHIIETEEGAIE